MGRETAPFPSTFTAPFNKFVSYFIQKHLEYENLPSNPLHNYESFVHAGIGVSEELDFKRGTYNGVLGDDDFVKMVGEKAELIPEMNLTVSDLVKAVCEFYEIDIVILRKPGKVRHASNVRAMLALLVRESNELTLEELAQILERDASSLSKHAARLTTKSLKFEKLHHEIGEVRAFVFQMPECQTWPRF